MDSNRDLVMYYGKQLNVTDIDPELALQLLQHRTELFRQQDKLDLEDFLRLSSFDMSLIDRSEEFVEQIEKVYDFTASDEQEIPPEQWWWHLNKISLGHLDFSILLEEEQVI
ncbi:hypothetical protein [Halobacillus salinus]|uniref:Uncharacterized protein n=1 Tax=Halobacillus salinus TaxID=192814 RepID=A0A4Z0H4B8_9BACI|nr:hypothetical protein [Halobacillus salinus]TGB04950.1 hypothetical protein E4663_08135 [Halobacillus salinus]